MSLRRGDSNEHDQVEVSNFFNSSGPTGFCGYNININI